MTIYNNIFLATFLLSLLGCSMNKTRIEHQTLLPEVPVDTLYGENTVDYFVSESEGTIEIDAVTGATKAETNFAFLAGASYGGLVENDNKNDISGVTAIDAITGATKLAYNVGIHSILKGHGRTIEIGLDYINLDKSIEYEMPSLSVSGTRSFKTHQIRLPLTYNFLFFKNHLERPRLVLKVGLSAGYTFSKTITDSDVSANMPDYEFSDWDACAKFGFCYYPFDFSKNYRLGFYLDSYRGLKVYEDIYHEAAYLGGNAFTKFGILFEP